MKSIKFLIVVSLVLWQISSVFATPLKIRVTEGNFKKTSIAVSQFYLPQKNTKLNNTAYLIQDIIKSDLKSSGLFATAGAKKNIQKPYDMRYSPRFADWRILKIQTIVTGKITLTAQGYYKIVFFVWDSYQQKKLYQGVYIAADDGIRRLGHMIADDIYSRITGESGYFDSRIAYVAKIRHKGRQEKRIVVMDSDGKNAVYITDGKTLVLMPRLSPDGEKIVYTSYRRGVAGLYLQDLLSGKVNYFPGFTNTTYAPRFSHNGKKMIFATAENGTSNFWVMDMETHSIKRILKSSYIDTSPAYSPDGKKIVFTSNRRGKPALYVMNANGKGRIRKISRGKGAYTTPVWSPRGDKIAFTKQRRGNFYIGIMNVNGTGERVLTKSYLDESPSFSPNGRVLLFFRKKSYTSKMKLMSIDITGYNLQIIKTATEATDGYWGSLNKR